MPISAHQVVQEGNGFQIQTLLKILLLPPELPIPVAMGTQSKFGSDSDSMNTSAPGDKGYIQFGGGGNPILPATRIHFGSAPCSHPHPFWASHPGLPVAIPGPASHNCGTRQQQGLIDCASQQVLQENDYMCSNQCYDMGHGQWKSAEQRRTEAFQDRYSHPPAGSNPRFILFVTRYATTFVAALEITSRVLQAVHCTFNLLEERAGIHVHPYAIHPNPKHSAHKAKNLIRGASLRARVYDIGT
ncbi:hypothetical protein FIBSPDRAFT_886607 [Athelia psychrophila]|uniref:Uncharacterized protein n=1 Tax=Athelia psychrophila TaxID=1759441 RepID=A0A166QNQ1_9AGAM|nr:hypothetical protein FIBSPDRAFT_886607 [Fibularhizoctonia sp. CBS 109695]